MALNQQETFNWLVEEKTRLERELSIWQERCFAIALRAARDEPAIRQRLEAERRAETVDASVFDFVLR